MQYYLSGIVLRSCQILVDASIWIAFGFFIAAILRNMVGPAKTKAIFGDNSRFGLLIGWAIGMLLPVCSLGVLPVLAELYRSRVKIGTIVTFGLTAPLFNPISVLYGLSLPNPFAILVFAALAVLIVTLMGAVWGRFVKLDEKQDVKNDTVEIPMTGVRRSLGVIYSASTNLVGWPLFFLAIGVLASATVAASFPAGSLQGATEPDDIWAPSFMAVFITPIYSTPLLAMSQIGGMFQHGNSIGAAFSLLILGAGVNLGVVIWFAIAFGWRKIFAFTGLLIAITLVLAYSLDKPLYPKGVETAGHTHAFDIYTHPYPKSGVQISQAFGDAREYQLDNGWTGPYLLLILGLLGLVFRGIQLRWDFESWLFSRLPVKNSTKWDFVLPSWLIGLVACICLVVASIYGTYIYYPDTESVLGDLSAINTNCVAAARSGKYEIVEKTVPQCEDLSRRLEVGVFLRTWKVSDFNRAKAKIYREKLDELRDQIESGHTENVPELAMDVQKSYLQMARAFREQ